MSLLVSQQTDFIFYNNTYETNNGITYQDVVVFEYYDDGYIYAFFWRFGYRL
jgi:hypothetical protein